LLRCAPDQLLADLNYFGYLFEALVGRDLRVFADVVDGTVQHYRDSDDLEIDAVVTASGGRWAAFEVKLGLADIDMVDASAGASRRSTGNAGLPPECAWSRERDQITDHGTGMRTSATTPPGKDSKVPLEIGPQVAGSGEGQVVVEDFMRGTRGRRLADGHDASVPALGRNCDVQGSSSFDASR